MDHPVGALGVAEQVEDGLDALQARLDPVLGGAGEDLGLDPAHALGDLDGAGRRDQVRPVPVRRAARAVRAGRGGSVRQDRLPVVPVVRLVLIDLGQEGVELVEVAGGDHIGGDELAQGRQVLGLRRGQALGAGDPGPAGPGDARLIGGAVVRPGRVARLGRLQVGQQLGVDAPRAGRPAPGPGPGGAVAEDGVDDGLPRGALGDAEGGAGAGSAGAAAPGIVLVPAVAVVVTAVPTIAAPAAVHGVPAVPVTAAARGAAAPTAAVPVTVLLVPTAHGRPSRVVNRGSA